MRHIRKSIEQRYLLACFIFGFAGLGGIFIPSSAIGDNSVADEIVSLNVTDKPLGEVLRDISIAVGCQFSMDESWEDYPITASFDNEPLYRGLKLIFRDLNNAVIYGADHTIRIIIYDESESSGKGIGPEVTNQPSQDTSQSPLRHSEATAPQPDVEFSEDGGNREDLENRPGANAESASDENETDTENTEAHDEEAGEADSEGTIAATGPAEQDDDSDDESNQSEEIDSSSGDLEDSERTENNEESTEN